jgi:hypothetical protein
VIAVYRSLSAKQFNSLISYFSLSTQLRIRLMLAFYNLLIHCIA